MRIRKVRKALEYFLVLRTLDNGCRRWIEYIGWEVDRDDTGVYITTPINPTPKRLEGSRCFGNYKHICLREKDRLNSEIVRDEEPETFKLPTWQELYKRTHIEV